ncbi:MAG: anti-sigma factor domain-containing protein [Jiangellaceae bacterium]
MSHVDPELLALHALGELLPTAAAAHLDSCPDCSAEIASLRGVVGLGRSLGGDDVLVAPPAPVWGRIAAATGVDPQTLLEAEHTRPEGHVAVPAQVPAPAGPGRQRASWVLAAAAAGVVAGGAAVLVGQALTTGDDGVDRPVIATATLDPVADLEANGTASIVAAGDDRELTISLDSASPPDAYLEVWLLAPDASRLVSLGVLSGDSATFAVPAGLDLEAFPVVDVSVEPFDGDPAHSGDSVVRGTLAVA